MELLYDPSGALTLRDVTTSYASGFQPVQVDAPVANIGSGVVWMRCTIQNTTFNQPFLYLRDPMIESIELFTYQDSTRANAQPADDSAGVRPGTWLTSTITRREGGVMVPHGGDVDVMFHTFALSRQRAKPQTVYLRLKNFPAVVMDISVGTRSACLRSDREHTAFLAAILGVLGAMIVYNLFVYASVQSRAYLYYVLYGIAAATTVCYEQGLLPVLIGHAASASMSHALAVFVLVPMVLAILFTMHFLELRRIAPVMGRILSAICGTAGILIMGNLAGLRELTNALCWPLAAVGVGTLLASAVMAYARGYRAARYFLISWTVWSVSLLVYLIVGVFGLTPALSASVVVFYAVPFATVSEVVLMSFALADRINILQDEKLEAQEQAMTLLEERVRERTKKYEDANAALVEATQEIQRQMFVQMEQAGELKRMNSTLSERSEQVEHANAELAAANEEIRQQIDVQTAQSHELEIANAELTKRNELFRSLNLELDRANTDISRVNDQLNTQNEQLSALNNEKSEILGMASHDLKNPLTSILGIADILRRGHQHGLAPEQYEVFGQHIYESGERMLRLLHNLLDVNAADAGRVAMDFVQIDVENAVRAVLNEYLSRAAKKNLALQFRNEAPSGTQILADETAFRQVLDNLLSNAVKYSPAGKNIIVSIATELSEARTQAAVRAVSTSALSEFASNTEAFVHIAVRDEGPGLSAEDKHKLFGKFARLSARPTGGEDSTGLGLAIVKKLTEAMNGRVWCDSIPSEGATFVVELPIVRPALTTAKKYVSVVEPIT